LALSRLTTLPMSARTARRPLLEPKGMSPKPLTSQRT
jgi:hypothetical protein